MRLRKLDCSTLKFLRLPYKIRTLVELPPEQFDFLVEEVSAYAENRKLSRRLRPDDIDKAFYVKFDAEDEDLLNPAATAAAQQAESNRFHQLPHGRLSLTTRPRRIELTAYNPI